MERARHCSRAMARGLAMRVLDGVNARSLAGSGIEQLSLLPSLDFKTVKPKLPFQKKDLGLV